jgi:integral membrane protein
MSALLETAIGRLRLVSGVEGLSYVLLLFIAMPLKYAAGFPQAVRVVGMAHGVLFVGFVAALVAAWIDRRRGDHRWGLLRPVGIFALSLVPFGALVIERMLKAEPR